MNNYFNACRLFLLFYFSPAVTPPSLKSEKGMKTDLSPFYFPQRDLESLVKWGALTSHEDRGMAKNGHLENPGQ